MSPPPPLPANSLSSLSISSSSGEDEDMTPGDGSTATSSVLGDGPTSYQPMKDKIQAFNRPCCPVSLTAALLSLPAREEDDDGGSEAEDDDDDGERGDDEGPEPESGSDAAAVQSGSAAGSDSDEVERNPLLGSGSREEPIAGAPLLDQPLSAPPLGPIPSTPLDPSAAEADPYPDPFPPLQPQAPGLAGSATAVAASCPVPAPVLAAPVTTSAASALEGSQPAQSHGFRPQPSAPTAVAANTAAAANGSSAQGGDNAAPIDMVQFRKNQSELNRIRAQLKALKGKELANYQRGRNVGGRNFMTSHNSMVQNPARQVFDKRSQPTFVAPMTKPGSNGPPLSMRQPPPSLTKPWVAAVCSNLDEKRFNLSFRAPHVVNGEILVEASDESLNMARNRWSDYLVGHFLEGRLPFPLVEEIANRMWAKHGLIETLSYNKDFFLFKLPEATSREKLLDHGPFLFGGRPLILQQWTPSLVLSKARLSKIPLWVKIYNIPLAMWNPIGLGDIASAIGVPLFADSTTEKLQRFDFARICVEVDASKPLLDEFKLLVQGQIVNLQVVYQWRPKRCPTCCTFGHFCPKVSSPPAHVPALNHAGSAAGSAGPAAVSAGSGLGPAAPAGPIAFAGPAAVVGSILGPYPTAVTAIAPAAIAVSAPAAVAAPSPELAPVVVPVGTPVTVPMPAPIASPVPAPVGSLSVDLDRYVDGLVCDTDDSADGYEEGLNSAMVYSIHSPKTRGQKARKEMSLTFIPPQPKGSGKKGKKKGKRAKR